MKKKVCAYVMTVDSGLAPNPFHGACTLAVCTPNHVRARLGKDDYIVGVAGKSLSSRVKGSTGQPRLVYAMKIDKVLPLGDYYANPEFKSKIPRLSGARKVMCGDNFYASVSGTPTHTRETSEHMGEEIERQDRDGDRVFIARSDFHYFGSCAPEIPIEKKWGERLINQLRRRAVNVTYIYGGSVPDPWTDIDFEEFKAFLASEKLDFIPDPIDFSDWHVESLSKQSCAKASLQAD